jgi:acetylornithine deacetylase
VGHERDALVVLESQLQRLGFEVMRLPIDDDVADDPLAGVPSCSYAGRFQVVGHRGGGAARSLLLNGHIDVVPADEPGLWTTDPFTPVRRDGWLWGRGAGDMKAGFAMGVLAIRAADAVSPGAAQGPLTFLGVIEEECTGNGTLAAARAGLLADAVVLLEPTDLNVMLGGVGILWADVEIDGFAAHAEAADRAVNPIEVALRLVPFLRGFEEYMNTSFTDPVFAAVDRPYNLNIGVMHAGDWPSSRLPSHG